MHGQWFLLHENPLTRAITQPPRPPPLILAPKAPFSRATATRWSAFSQLTPTALKCSWQAVKACPRFVRSFHFQSLFHLLGQLTNLMEMGQNFLPFSFNLLNRLTGIAVNPRIRNHQTRFYTQLQRVKPTFRMNLMA